MSEVSKYISAVDLKVAELIHYADVLKSQLRYQESRNNDLLLELAEKNKRITLQEDQIGKLQTAQVISSTGAVQQDARSKINELVREIDKCIALLNK